MTAVTLLWPVVERLGDSVGDHYHPAQTVGMRYAVHVLVLVALCLPLGAKRLITTRRLWPQLARGFCMFAMPATFVLAAASIPIRSVWAVFWFAPLAIVAIGQWWLKERFPRRAWLLVAAAYVGALAVLSPPIPRGGVPLLFSVLSGVSFAVYVVLCRRLREEWLGASLLFTGLVPLLVLLPFMIAWWRPIQVQDCWAIFGLGVAGLLLLASLDRALERVSASFVAPFLFGAVVCERLLDAFLSARAPSPVEAGGVLVVLTAAAVVLARGLRSDVGHEH